MDKLTALGYTPANPQGPDQINAKIVDIYNGRYTAGYNAGNSAGYSAGYTAGKAAGTSIPGMFLNLSIAEGDYGGQTQAILPINGLTSIAFTVNKGFYGQFYIYLNGAEYYRAMMQTVLTNQRFNIALNKAYSSISFLGNPHGGSGSTITISDFAVT